MLKVKQVINGVITGMDEVHDGLLRIGKGIVFVRYVLEREEAHVRIVRCIAKGYINEVVEIKRASPFRKPVKCPIYGYCGSCQLLYINAQGQHVPKNQNTQALCDGAKRVKLQTEDIVMTEEP